MDERIRAMEIEVARRGERLEHIQHCVELMQEDLQRLTSTISALERTVLVKFSEMNGRELQARRIAVVVSTVVSIIVAVASVAIASII